MRSRETLLMLSLGLTALGSPALLGQEQQALSTEQAREPAQPVYEFRDQAEVGEALERVLSDPEFRWLHDPKRDEADKEPADWQAPAWLERLLEWLSRWLTPDSSKDGSFSLAPLDVTWLRLIVYLLVGAALAAVVFVVIRAVLRRAAAAAAVESGKIRIQEDGVPSTPPGELASREYLSRAMGLAAGGDYKAAIRQLLLGAMSWIERHGLIRYRKGLTNGDYLRAVAARGNLREPLEGIVGAFERVYFGRRAATSEGFKQCVESFRRGFPAE